MKISTALYIAKIKEHCIESAYVAVNYRESFWCNGNNK